MGVAWPGIPHWPDEPVAEAAGFVLPEARMDLAPLLDLFRALSGRHGAAVGTHSQDGRLDVVAAHAEDWMVRVYFNEGEDVQNDAQLQAADCYAGHPRAAEIAQCARLVQILVADPDCHVAAFDFLDTAREWLKAQPGVIALHPDTGEPL
jgi:hypothetical protein